MASGPRPLWRVLLVVADVADGIDAGVAFGAIEVQGKPDVELVGGQISGSIGRWAHAPNDPKLP